MYRISGSAGLSGEYRTIRNPANVNPAIVGFSRDPYIGRHSATVHWNRMKFGTNVPRSRRHIRTKYRENLVYRSSAITDELS